MRAAEHGKNGVRAVFSAVAGTKGVWDKVKVPLVRASFTRAAKHGEDGGAAVVCAIEAMCAASEVACKDVAVCRARVIILSFLHLLIFLLAPACFGHDRTSSGG